MNKENILAEILEYLDSIGIGDIEQHEADKIEQILNAQESEVKVSKDESDRQPYGIIAPLDWDAEVDAVADFDAEVDADGAYKRFDAVHKSDGSTEIYTDGVLDRKIAAGIPWSIQHWMIDYGNLPIEFDNGFCPVETGFVAETSESKVIPGVLFSDGEFVPIKDDSIMQWIAEQLPGDEVKDGEKCSGCGYKICHCPCPVCGK